MTYLYQSGSSRCRADGRSIAELEADGWEIASTPSPWGSVWLRKPIEEGSALFPAAPAEPPGRFFEAAPASREVMFSGDQRAGRSPSSSEVTGG